jgi:hypothetical protein
MTADQTVAPVHAPSLSRTQILRLLAHHEAGHAVVAAHLGLAVTSLELHEYDRDGAWSADGITYVTYFPRLADEFAVQGAAGELAAMKWLDERGLLSDETAVAASADHDRTEVVELLAEDGIRVSWPDVRSRALDLVAALWPQIEAVASAAAVKGRLTEAEIADLLAGYHLGSR